MYVFLDNFRGFKRTLFPIEDVSFLVGENSTGKTSLIELVGLIGSYGFWRFSEFGTTNVGFGHFNDIVSIGERDRTYFRIGAIAFSETASTRRKRRLGGMLATFSSHEGLPRLSSLNYTWADKQVCATLAGGKLMYRLSPAPSCATANDFQNKILQKWLDNDFPESSYVQVEEPAAVGEASSIFMCVYRIYSDLIEQEKPGYAGEPPFPVQLQARTGSVVSLAPIRSKPQRTYDAYRREFSPEGEHTPYVIRRTLDSKAQAAKFKEAIRRIGRNTGLFEDVRIKKYRKTATAPFELDIVLSRKAISVSNVGYGVSQALPVIVELLIRSEDTLFAIQQPEIHLHPKAQAALGDMLFELAVSERKRFIVETHSDYIIDRFRYRMMKSGAKRKPRAQVAFFERRGKGNVLHLLPIDSKGTLPSQQPDMYREFFIREQLRMVEF